MFLTPYTYIIIVGSGLFVIKAKYYVKSSLHVPVYQRAVAE